MFWFYTYSWLHIDSFFLLVSWAWLSGNEIWVKLEANCAKLLVNISTFPACQQPRFLFEFLFKFKFKLSQCYKTCRMVELEANFPKLLVNISTSPACRQPAFTRIGDIQYMQRLNCHNVTKHTGWSNLRVIAGYTFPDAVDRNTVAHLAQIH